MKIWEAKDEKEGFMRDLGVEDWGKYLKTSQKGHWIKFREEMHRLKIIMGGVHNARPDGFSRSKVFS